MKSIYHILALKCDFGADTSLFRPADFLRNSIILMFAPWQTTWLICIIIERFSFECHEAKTKTKVITLANHKKHRQYSEPIKLEVITCSWRKARQATTQLVLVLLLIGWKSGANLLSQSRSVKTKRKRKTNYFLTLKWKPLYQNQHGCYCEYGLLIAAQSDSATRNEKERSNTCLCRFLPPRWNTLGSIKQP